MPAGRPKGSKNAVQFNGRHSEMCKARIRSSLLLSRLQNHALGKLKKPMDDSQIRAAQILLAKTVSDAPKVLATDPKNPIIPKEIAIIGVRAKKD